MDAVKEMSDMFARVMVWIMSIVQTVIIPKFHEKKADGSYTVTDSMIKMVKASMLSVIEIPIRPVVDKDIENDPFKVSKSYSELSSKLCAKMKEVRNSAFVVNGNGNVIYEEDGNWITLSRVIKLTEPEDKRLGMSELVSAVRKELPGFELKEGFKGYRGPDFFTCERTNLGCREVAYVTSPTKIDNELKICVFIERFPQPAFSSEAYTR